MKPIYNYKLSTVADIESDGLLDEATKLHVMSFKMKDKEVMSLHGEKEVDRIKAFFKYHIDNEIPVVGHNFVTFDVPLVEKLLGMDLTNLMVIDTLALSWYLNTQRKEHGLDSFFEDYGIAKPPITDWEGLSYEEYRFRCQEDVRINYALWQDLIYRLEDMYALSKEKIDEGVVGGKRVSPNEEIYLDRFIGDSVEDHVNRILTFLMFKMDCARLQEKTMWEVDVPYLKESEQYLLSLVESAAKELESVMPPVPKYSARKQPAKPFKKNGELSAAGENWERLKRLLLSEEKDEYGNLKAKVIRQGEIHELTKYDPPNINSSQQVKDFLFSKGWKPTTFKYVRDKEEFEAWIRSKPAEGSPRGSWTLWKNSKPVDREIPQINADGEDGKELCESILELAETVPEIKALENYSVVKHRLGTVQGFLKNLKKGKYLQARIGGFTNTLRMKHSEIVNLPAATKPFAESIRGCLIAGSGKVSLGSDLSGLEDRVKHHFMIPHDPEYVATMMEDNYDPHIYMAYGAGLISEKQYLDFKNGIKDEFVVDARRKGKTLNYSCVYGAGGAKVASTLGVSEQEGKDLVEGYWKVNWSVEAIAKDQVVVECQRGLRWLINPVNGLLYNIRSEKDIFSTLAQGTGAFMFDNWVDRILTKMKNKWGVVSLTYQAHDELVIVCRDKEPIKKVLEDMVRESIEEVSEKFLLRRKLGCEVQFGQRYSEIH